MVQSHFGSSGNSLLKSIIFCTICALCNGLVSTFTRKLCFNNHGHKVNDLSTKMLSQNVENLPLLLSSTSIPLASSDVLITGFFSGAASSAAKEFILHPIDTIRARVQNGAKYRDPELYFGLFNGVLPALISGTPASAVFFGVKDYVKFEMMSSYHWDKEFSTIIAVAVASIPYWIIRNPGEIIKTRDQLSLKSDVQQQADYPTLKNVGSFYVGFWFNVLYSLPADVIKFLAYEYLVLHVFQKEAKLEGLEAAFAGALASIFAQYLTTPLDVVRTRIMCEKPSEIGTDRKKNPFQEIAYIAQSEGISALFLGSIPRLGRALASGSIQFASYEMIRNNII